MEAKDDATLDVEEGKTLYLLDAMALAYRAHYVFISRPLINSKGQNTSASYGFVNSLLKLIEKHNMEHIAVVFDAVGEGGTFRDDIYDEYKAHRDPPPDELLENLPYIKEIVRALDIPVIEIEGVEADDVIGTLARRAEADGAKAVIVSPDKDFQQLLTPSISIYKPARRGEEFDPITDETFREEFELEPRQFIDMLALMGDSSDNVPGVYGIGEKTAAKLLKQYETVENLLEHKDDISGKRAREGLQEHEEDARLSKKLVTIKTDLDVNLDWKRLLRQEADTEQLVELFTELEFGSLLDRLKEDEELIGDGSTSVDEAAEKVENTGGSGVSFDFGPYEKVKQFDEDAVDYTIVHNTQELEKLAVRLAAQDRYAVDTETTSTDKMWASLVGISFSWEEGTAHYVPTPLPDGTRTDAVIDTLRASLEGDALKIGHNLKYDIVVLARHGVLLKGPLFDTMVAHYLVAPEGQHGLSEVARKYLSYRMIPITELIGDGKDRTMRDVAVEEAGPYACEDADITGQLEAPLRSALEEDELLDIAETMEFPLVHVLAEMERTGIRIDNGILEEISAQLGEKLEALETEIHEMAGTEFNINSTQQLSEVLFEKLDLPVVAKTSTGRPSTKESVLQELSSQHDLPERVLDWRRLSKLKSTYVDSLGELVHPETGRIHTSFNQTITATGRLSSSDPNLQNIPVRTELGREIRRAFVPEEGWLLLAADYVQIELRILASMSDDDALRAAFENGEDIHTTTAALMYDVEPEAVTPDQRRKAKEVNYGIPYGISPWGLAQRLQTTVDEAQDLINGYRRSYPAVSRYLAEQVEDARRKGYVETMLGRRRFVPDIDASNSNRRQFAERVAVNMPIQGTQADMIKLAMVRVDERLEREEREARMLLQVHDELVLEVPPEEKEAVIALVEEEMVQAHPLDVPVAVEINAAGNWLDAH